MTSYRKKYPLHFSLILTFMIPGMILGPIVGWLTFYNPFPNAFPTPIANVTDHSNASSLYHERIDPNRFWILLTGVPIGGIGGLVAMYAYLYHVPLGGASREEQEKWRQEKIGLKVEEEARIKKEESK